MRVDSAKCGYNRSACTRMAGDQVTTCFSVWVGGFTAEQCSVLAVACGSSLLAYVRTCMSSLRASLVLSVSRISAWIRSKEWLSSLHHLTMEMSATNRMCGESIPYEVPWRSICIAPLSPWPFGAPHALKSNEASH